jgi:tetratricopeptide (TPR) repeat protein
MINNIIKRVLITGMLIFVLFLCGCTRLKYNNIGNYNSNTAEKLCREKRYKEALKSVDDFLKKYPNNKLAIGEKAYILISSGKNDEGLVLLTNLYEGGQNSSAVLNNISWGYNNLHMYSMANKYIDKSIKFWGATDKEYVNKGNALHGLGKRDEAIKYYDKALDKNSNSTFAVWGEGLCAYENKEYRKAIEYFKKYGTLNGGDKSYINYIKNSYLKLNDYDGAISELKNQISANGDNTSVYNSIAQVYEKKGDYSKALDYYDLIINQSPDDADAYYSKSICLVKLGKNDEACDNLKLAIKYDEEYLYDIMNNPEFDALKNNPKFKALKSIQS